MQAVLNPEGQESVPGGVEFHLVDPPAGAVVGL
jgi:hypothetical protein